MQIKGPCDSIVRWLRETLPYVDEMSPSRVLVAVVNLIMTEGFDYGYLFGFGGQGILADANNFSTRISGESSYNQEHARC